MNNEINRLQIRFKTVYNGQPWYGESVDKALREISVKQAFLKPGSAHSIAEIVTHLISWRIFLQKRLAGDERFDVNRDTTFRWEAYGDSPEQVWEKLLLEFDRNQKAVLELITGFKPKNLDEQVPGRTYTFRDLIEGVLQHDLYHLGQIVLLKKHFIN